MTDMEIEITEQEQGLNFVRYWEELKESDSFTFTFSRTLWNEESGCITFIGDEQAMSLWMQHHKDAKYTDSITDGMRAINAIGRAGNMTGKKTTVEAVLELVNGDGGSITVEKTEKGRLWSVIIGAPEDA